jgi:transglutaminase-like putative cysteine protease
MNVLEDVVSPRSVDWARVRRASFAVRHRYRYAYQAPVTNLTQRLVMLPPDRHGDQRLLDHTLRVSGAEGPHSLTWEIDRFGNRVAHVAVSRVVEAIEFEADYHLERVVGPSTEPAAAASYLEPTALTAPDARLKDAARAIRLAVRAEAGGWNCDAVSRALAERAHDWAAGAITYQVGVTGVQTPAAMALYLGGGVCQDYAHILLCVLRLLDVPARYVSGHLLGEGVPHAWVEALVVTPNGVEVIAYDPTHRRRAGLQYITVAVGRDFADVSPTSGSFTGPALGVMTWGKHASIVSLEYA